MNIETELKQVTTIILKLSLSEAKWLKDYLQNPFIRDESIDDKLMREEFYNSIHALPYIEE